MSLLMKSEPLQINIALCVLVLMLIITSLAVIYSRYSGRNEFVVLQQLETKRDSLNEEWGRLLLEQSTWANPARIENQAVLRLDMMTPIMRQTVFIKL